MEEFTITRRDFLRATSAIGAAFGLQATGLTKFAETAEAKETAAGGLPVLWLQAQACTGCSVSLLNSIYYATIDDLRKLGFPVLGSITSLAVVSNRKRAMAAFRFSIAVMLLMLAFGGVLAQILRASVST